LLLLLLLLLLFITNMKWSIAVRHRRSRLPCM